MGLGEEISVEHEKTIGKSKLVLFFGSSKSIYRNTWLGARFGAEVVRHLMGSSGWGEAMPSSNEEVGIRKTGHADAWATEWKDCNGE